MNKQSLQQVIIKRRPLLALLLPDLTRPDIPEFIHQAAQAGVDWFIVRNRTIDDDILRKAVASITSSKPASARIILNHPVYTGWLRNLNIDGWHMPESTEPHTCHPGEGRDDKSGNNKKTHHSKQFETGFLTGQSVHSVAAAKKAYHNGIDYIIAGTMFETASHPGKKPEGLSLLTDIRKTLPDFPMLAIGGITPGNTPDCLKAGADGIVVQSGILHAIDPVEAIHLYRNQLGHDQSDN